MSASKTGDICFAMLQQLSKPEILNSLKKSSKYLLCFTLMYMCMLLSCSNLLTKFIARETPSARSQIISDIL